jgi:regulatory protein
MMQRKPLTAENAQARLEALCARSEHCSYELRLKMRQWGLSDADAMAVLKDMTRNRFVDDRRFAQSFAIDKFRFAQYGRVKISMALRAKRIPAEYISDALEQIDEDEYWATVVDVTTRRAARGDDMATFEGRTKIYRYVVGRGFESELVSRALRKLIKDELG